MLELPGDLLADGVVVPEVEVTVPVAGAVVVVPDCVVPPGVLDCVEEPFVVGELGLDEAVVVAVVLGVDGAVDDPAGVVGLVGPTGTGVSVPVVATGLALAVVGVEEATARAPIVAPDGFAGAVGLVEVGVGGVVAIDPPGEAAGCGMEP